MYKYIYTNIDTNIYIYIYISLGVGLNYCPQNGDLNDVRDHIIGKVPHGHFITSVYIYIYIYI